MIGRPTGGRLDSADVSDPAGSSSSDRRRIPRRASTSVTEIADTLTWVRAHCSRPVRLALGTAERAQILPHRPGYTFSTLFTDLRARRAPGSRSRSFLLGGSARSQSTCSRRDSQSGAHRNRFVRTIAAGAAVNLGLRYTSTSVHPARPGGVFNLETQQLDYLAERAATRRTRAALAEPRTAARPLAPSAARPSSAPGGLVWIEMAGITTPFTTPSFPFPERDAAHA